jgi:hypothetical protein
MALPTRNHAGEFPPHQAGNGPHKGGGYPRRAAAQGCRLERWRGAPGYAGGRPGVPLHDLWNDFRVCPDGTAVRASLGDSDKVSAVVGMVPQHKVGLLDSLRLRARRLWREWLPGK